MKAETLFELRGVELRYGGQRASTRVLEIPRLVIGRGERLALVGPNGSGKTSLLKILNGLLAPSAGCASFLGEATVASPQLRSRSVYLHQHPYLLAGTVAYNVGFGCRGRGLAQPEIRRRIADSLALLGLSGFERRSHRALSGGEAQRVALARALATGADILLLDEPTSSVDAESALLIRAVLDRASKRGATILFTTHDRSLADEMASERIRLESGRIIEDTRKEP
jgi:tungstate transport system ATP-binding protein